MGPKAPRETGYVEVEGGRLYFETAGAGHPVLFIHADCADCRMWDVQFDAAARQQRVIRYDKRGFGKTTSYDGVFSHRQDIVSLLQHLGVAKTTVVGLSNGGRLAIDLTLEHPELVDVLVVASGGISGKQPPATEDEMRLFGTYAALQERQDFDALTALGVHVWADGPTQREDRADPHVRQQLREMLVNNYHAHREHLQPVELEPPAIGRLHEVRVPLLAIAGDLDFSGTIAAMELLARSVTGANYIVFPDTAHMVNMEMPERFNALVLDFVASAL
jgi:pimeloyl-ACP methyl ester carboxylesterase